MDSPLPRFVWLRQSIFGWALALTAPFALAGADDSFFDLDLNEVLNLEITSVSKKPQTVSRAAAAVFVITADDIRRSGATTIPDVLRMAPGIFVGQISASSWAVSSRGASGRFTNKLLVLIDGRSVYTPTFSGVYWDVQDMVLADIERIEIIRGPGAALWGANAVDGVINIISKSAAATQGGLLTVNAGKEERATAALRYGGKIGDVGHWRIYGKGFDRDASVVESTGKPGNDDWRQQRLGFRTDLVPGNNDSLTIQGDIYRGRHGDSSRLNFLIPPYHSFLGTDQQVAGGNLLTRWQHEVSASDSFTWQAYIDYSRRDWPAHLQENRRTVDLDFQYRTRRFAGHDLVMGAAYRHSSDTLEPSARDVPVTAVNYTVFNPTSTRRQLLSAFVQDDIILSPDLLVLTLGIKLEHNDYTGLESQPNARLLWTPNENTTLWTSVARAVRTPSRVDQEGIINQDLTPPNTAVNPLPWPVLNVTNGRVSSESLVAYEAGWKQKVSPTLSFDLALFHNDYDKLRTYTLSQPLCQPSGLPLSAACFMTPTTYALVVAVASNQTRAWSQGFELSGDWRPLNNLLFRGALSRFSMHTEHNANAVPSDQGGSFPKWQGSLRIAWNPRPNIDFDLWLRRVGAQRETLTNLPAPSYNELDLRLAWHPSKAVELAVVGRNLLHRQHMEFSSELQDMSTMLVQRSIFGQFSWKF